MWGLIEGVALIGQAPVTVSAHPPLNFRPLAPELILVGAGLALMLVDALEPRTDHRVLAALAFLGVAVAAVAAVLLWSWTGPITVLGDMVAVDRFAVFFTLVILAVAGLAIPLAHHYLGRAGEERGEFYPLLLFATAGMALIVSAADLIMVFLALEILSLSLYLLTGFSFRRMASAEGSMKYFLLGAFSSAFFLYGVAFAYGATRTTSIAGISHALAGQAGSQALALVATGLLTVGFAFKVAAVPFHMWTPDAYQGAPTPVTAFMSAGTKVAAFGALLRVFNVALQPLTASWRPFVVALAAITMVAGSVLALAQTNIKRLLAYSSIAHAGFILVGVSAGTTQGIEASMFYLAVYAVMILGAFGVVMLASVRGERHVALSSYSGLARRSPFLAAVLTVLLLSLGGIPPTAGFIAKAAVFGAAIQAGSWPLALVGVIASVIAASAYIRVVVLMYMRDPGEAGDAAAIERSGLPDIVLALTAVVTVLFGVFPSILYAVLQSASVIHF